MRPSPALRQALWATLALCVVPFGAALAAEEGEPPPRWGPAPFDAGPDAVRAAAEAHPAVPDELTTMLYAETTVEWLADGQLRTRVRRVERIDSPGAIEHRGTFGVAWKPTTSDRPVMRARVIDPDGVAHWMDQTGVAESSAGAIGPDRFDDRKVMAGPLPRVAVGAIIETESVITSPRATFASGARFALPLISPVDALHHRFEWRAPSGTPLTVAVIDADVEPEAQTADGVDIWSVDVFRRERSAPETGGDLPWDLAGWPRVVIGAVKSWNAASTEYHGVVEATLKGGVDPALVADLPRDDAREAARVLAERIAARVRYTGVHFGAGAVIPRAPAEVVQSGFGDCKDLAVLFVGGMRAAGYPARVALIRTEGPPTEASVAGLGAFDHAIARVDADGPLWVDLTAPHLPPGILPPGLYRRRALVIDPATKALERLPDSAAETHVVGEVERWRIGRDGSTVRFAHTSTGATGYAVKAALAADPQLADRIARHTARKRFEGDADDIDSTVEGAGARVSASVKSELGWVVGNESGVFYDLDPLFDPLPDALRDGPVGPVGFLLPMRTALDVTVEPPPGHGLTEGPEPGEHRLGPATLTVEREQTEAGVTWRWRLDPKTRRWSPDDVKAFRAAYAAFDTRANRRPIRFMHRGTRALIEGRVGEGLRIFRALAADGGVDEQALYLAALAENGYPAFVLPRAEALVAEHPEHAGAWAALASARMFGVFEPLVGELDRLGAAEAYRRLVKLDPKDADAAWSAVMAPAVIDGRWVDDREALAAALAVARNREDLRAVAAELALVLDAPADAAAIVATPRDEVEASLLLAARARSGDIDGGLAAVRRHMTDRATVQRVATAALIRLANVGAWQTIDAVIERLRLQVEFTLKPQFFTQATPPPTDLDSADAVVAGLLHDLMLGADDEALTRYATPELAEMVRYSPLARALRETAEMFEEKLGLQPKAAARILLGDARSVRPLGRENLTAVAMKIKGDVFTLLVEETADGPRAVGFWGNGARFHGQRIAAALERGDEAGALAWRLLISGATRAGDPLRIWGAPIDLGRALTAAGASPGLTAAALLSSGSDADRQQARGLLAAHRPEVDADDAQLSRALLGLDLALADDAAARIALLEPTLAAATDDEGRALSYMLLLRSAGRGADAERFAAALPEALRTSRAVERQRIEIAARDGRIDQAVARAQALLDAEPWPELANNAAWYAAFVPDADLAAAAARIEAVPPDQLSRAARHTLATLYGIQGQADRARGLLREITEDGKFFGPLDWLIVGLIAQAEGLPEVARDAYGRVPPDEGDDPVITARLAELLTARLGQ